MKVLVVATHPDDEVLGCGGVMMRHAAEGDEVHVLIMTQGDARLFSRAYVDNVRREAEEAHRILNVAQAHFLDFPAPRLDTVPGHELADAIYQVIDKVQPQTVYMPHQGDIHGDHRAVFLATLVAARPINGCPVRKLLAYETLSETEWAPPGPEAFTPTVFVEVTDHLEGKLKAMQCFKSQLKDPPHSRSLRTMEALARYRGGTVSVDAAEAFMLVREVLA